MSKNPRLKVATNFHRVQKNSPPLHSPYISPSNMLGGNIYHRIVERTLKLENFPKTHSPKWSMNPHLFSWAERLYKNIHLRFRYRGRKKKPDKLSWIAGNFVSIHPPPEGRKLGKEKEKGNNRERDECIYVCMWMRMVERCTIGRGIKLFVSYDRFQDRVARLRIRLVYGKLVEWWD